MKIHIYYLSLLFISTSSLYSAEQPSNLSELESLPNALHNIGQNPSNTDLIRHLNTSHRLRDIVFTLCPWVRWTASLYDKITLPNAHNGAVHSVFVSNESNIVSVGQNDGLINVWNGKKFKKIRTIVDMESPYLKTAFSPSSNILATYRADSDPLFGHLQKDRITRVWNIQTGKKIVEFKTPCTVFALEISPDGNIVATGHEGSVILWNISTGTSRSLMFDGVPLSLAFSPDGKNIAASLLSSGLVKVWNITTLTQDEQFQLQAKSAELTFLSDGKLIAHCNDSTEYSRLKTYDLRTGNQIGHLYFNGSFEIHIHALADNGILELGYDFTPNKLNSKPCKILRKLFCKSPITTIEFYPDDPMLVAGCKDGSIVAWKSQL